MATVWIGSISDTNWSSNARRSGVATKGPMYVRTSSSVRCSGFSNVAPKPRSERASPRLPSISDIAVARRPCLAKVKAGVKAGGGQLSCTSQLVNTSERTRSGTSTATSCAIAPPLSLPTRSNSTRSSWSSTSRIICAWLGNDRLQPTCGSVAPNPSRSMAMQVRKSARRSN